MKQTGLSHALRRHVDTLAGLIGPRHDGRPSSLEATTAYLGREWAAMGAAVRRETYPTAAGEAVNLIVEKPGSTRPDEIVILGAHYDTVATTPGADDNASAVAVLLEASRLLLPRRHKRTLRLVAFANEEPPHFYTDTMGSQIHARGCRKRGERVVGMVCLEMLGYFDPRRGAQAYPEGLPRALTWCLPKRGHFLGLVSNPRSAGLLYRFWLGFKLATRLPAWAVPLPQRIHEIRLSDHAPFWDEGFRALMVTDTSFLRNPHYHLPSDTPPTLDYPRMAKATRGVVGGMRWLL